MREEHSSEHPLSEPASLTGLIAYEAGSVVSRTIVKKRTGNITLFSFDEGEGLSEHSSPHDALVVLLDGRAKITVSGRSHEIAAGDAILFPANAPHALTALTPFKMMLVMIRESD